MVSLYLFYINQPYYCTQWGEVGEQGIIPITGNDNTYRYLVGIRDGNNLRLYINGVENPSYSPIDITGYGSLDSTDPLVIGAGTAGAGGGRCNYLNGSVGSVHIYSRALSAEEVLHNYNALKGRFGLT